MKRTSTLWLVAAPLALALAGCDNAQAQVQLSPELSGIPVAPFQAGGLKVGMTAGEADAILAGLDGDARDCNARGGSLMTPEVFVAYKTEERCRDNPDAIVSSISITLMGRGNSLFGAADAEQLVSAITDTVGGTADCTRRSETRADCAWNSPSTGADLVELRAGGSRPVLTLTGAPVDSAATGAATSAPSSDSADFVTAGEIDILSPFGARAYMPMNELHDMLLAAGLEHEANSSRRTCEYIIERPSSLRVRVSVTAGTRCDQQAPVEVLALTMNDYRPAANTTFVADDVAAAWGAKVGNSDNCSASEGAPRRRAACSWSAAPPPGYRGVTAERLYYPARSDKAAHSTMKLRTHWADPDAPPPPVSERRTYDNLEDFMEAVRNRDN